MAGMAFVEAVVSVPCFIEDAQSHLFIHLAAAGKRPGNGRGGNIAQLSQFAHGHFFHGVELLCLQFAFNDS